ncbi:MAG: hypothetical protein M1827_006705 [Pycnora praestabilis]|nr:MAG: hypothetical protein M1827_006705 [Pycnora praestabilis]
MPHQIQTHYPAVIPLRLFSSHTKPPKLVPQSMPSPTSPPTTLPHLTTTGSVHMVHITSKASTHRIAIARGQVLFSNTLPAQLIRSHALKKGDVLSVARVAGIMAAKKTADLVPLCHPIALTSVGVDVELISSESGDIVGSGGLGEFGGVTVQARVECEGKTGVEMEALTAVTGACLTIFDMCKAVDRDIRIEGMRVVLKEGGRSGTWREKGFEGG